MGLLAMEVNQVLMDQVLVMEIKEQVQDIEEITRRKRQTESVISEKKWDI